MAVRVARMNQANNTPIGAVSQAMLSEAQFQALNGPSWVLADGRDVTGSVYATVTGQTVIPDMRGVFLRGKNNGRVDGNQDPDGERGLGTIQNEEHKSHFHIQGLGTYNTSSGQTRYGMSTGLSGAVNADNEGSFAANQTTQGVNTSTIGGNETRPRNVTINYFVKINP